MINLLVTVIFSLCMWVGCRSDEINPPCDNANVDIKSCNSKIDDYVVQFINGPDFSKAVALLQQLTMPPYKKCSADVPQFVNGTVSVERSRDYCEWSTDGSKRKNLYMIYKVKSISYSCDYDATKLDLMESVHSVLDISKNKALSISITSCSLDDNLKNVQLQLPTNWASCIAGIKDQGWTGIGSFGGTFLDIPIAVQFHKIDGEVTVDKISVINDGSVPTSTKTCSGDAGFKELCQCFQSAPSFDSTALALVNVLFSCINKSSLVKDFLDHTICTN